MSFIHLTAGSPQKPALMRLERSAARAGFKTINLSHGRGFEKTSFIDKALLSHQFFLSGMVSSKDIILFTDAYDVVVLDHMDTIVQKFLEFGKDIVFGGEKVFWPLIENIPTVFGIDRRKISTYMQKEGSEHWFINSGVYIGYAYAIKKMLSFCVAENKCVPVSSDQAAVQAAYFHLIHDDANFAAIDTQARIFANSSNSYEVFLTDGLRVFERDTGCQPSVLHANGDKDIIDGADVILALRERGAWHISLSSLADDDGAFIVYDRSTARLRRESLGRECAIILASTLDGSHVAFSSLGEILTFTPDNQVNVTAQHVSDWEKIFFSEAGLPYLVLNEKNVPVSNFCNERIGDLHKVPLRLSDLKKSNDALTARLLSLP